MPIPAGSGTRWCSASSRTGWATGAAAWPTIGTRSSQTPGLQGGFIWEWADHALTQHLPDGRTRWAFGGDFGDEPNDGNYVLDGLVWPDRRPKPVMWEHKALASVGLVTPEPDAIAAGRLQLVNRQHFLDLSWLRASYETAIDGVTKKTAEFELPATAAGGKAAIRLPEWAMPDATATGEPWLTLHFRTANALPWAPAGFEIATIQVPLPPGRLHAAAVPGEAQRGSRNVELDAEGRLIHPLLHASPALSLWRAPTDNDRNGGLAAQWQAWGVDRLERQLVDIEHHGESVVVTSHHVTAAGIVVRHRVIYTGDGPDVVRVEEDVEVPTELADLGRIGTVLETVPGLESLVWFGSGPHETYPDRKRSGLVGRWSSSVTEQHVPYIRPQENGGHADVRWLQVRRASGSGLRLEMDAPRQASATHFRAHDLAVATHVDELRAVAETVVHLDAAHRGLGTASCGPDTLPEYRIAAGRHRWAWTLRTLS